jgi:hypothetical protein
MKLKKILGIVVSMLTIMLGGFVLCAAILGLLTNTFEFATKAEVLKELLVFAGYVAVAFVLVIVAKLLLTKEQHKYMISATFFAGFLMMVLFIIGIIFIGQPETLILAIGTVSLPVIGYHFVRKSSWTYIFATVYASCLVIFLMLFKIDQ